MIEILNTLVSLDLFKTFFCCDLSQCHGICCIEGDAGAPVTIDEVELLEEATETAAIWDDLTPEARQQIDCEGVVYPDKDGELVTQIVNDRDCVFVKHGFFTEPSSPSTQPVPCAFCAIDSAYRCGKFHWQKPISCALYPVRLSTVGGMTAVNVHRWDICQPARELGKKLQLPLYQFLKEPLIRRFGQAWWDECDLAAKELKKAGYLD
ncbi:MAG: DUF3109 family protein [Bacteroidaceae bacterium]|nr:DUF3109 family protein [Bacteroidaceae bacterium]